MSEGIGLILGGGRFEVVRELGEGGQGRTFLARDQEEGGREVVVKELLLGRVGDWKSVELFEREGKALRNLRHAQVPAYVDAFVGAEDGRFYLVQELVEGEDLQARIDRGALMDEGDAVDFMEQMLGVLGYLHGLSPPVIHRDLKPSNVMRRDDGTYVLIDFGAVQTLMKDRVGGSTVVGTTGYMAPEQLIGRAVASSDLYALAATVVHAVVGIRPSDLPMTRLRLDFREVAGLSDGLSDVLDRMLSPEVGDRFKCAGDVLVALGAVEADGWDDDDDEWVFKAARVKELGREGRVSDVYQPSANMLALLVNKPVEHGLCGARIEGGDLRLDVRIRESVVRGIALVCGGLLLAAILGVLGLLWGLGQLLIIPVVIGGLVLVVGWMKLWMRPAHDVLRVGRKGIEIVKYGLDSRVIWEKSLGFGEIDRMYLDFVGKDELEGRHGGRLKKNSGQRSRGIVWTTYHDERYLFGNEALSSLQKVLGGSVNLDEFEWMNDLIMTYWVEAVAGKSGTVEKSGGASKDEAVSLGLSVYEVAVDEASVGARR